MRKRRWVLLKRLVGSWKVWLSWRSRLCYTKFAVEGLSESMSYELEPFGIKVVIVEPGVIKTNFVTVVAKNLKIQSSPYSQIMQKQCSFRKHDGKWIFSDLVAEGSA